MRKRKKEKVIGLFVMIFCMASGVRAKEVEDPGEVFVYQMEATFRDTTGSGEGMCAVQDFQSGLWGYVDKMGEYVIPPSFEAAEIFSEGLAAVKIGGKWGFIDQTGNVVIEPSYDEITPCYADSQIVGFENGKSLADGFYIDHEGKSIGIYAEDKQRQQLVGKDNSEKYDLFKDQTQGLQVLDTAGNVVLQLSEMKGYQAESCRVVHMTDQHIFVRKSINDMSRMAVYDYDGNCVVSYQYQYLEPLPEDMQFLAETLEGKICVMDYDGKEVKELGMGHLMGQMGILYPDGWIGYRNDTSGLWELWDCETSEKQYALNTDLVEYVDVYLKDKMFAYDFSEVWNYNGMLLAKINLIEERRIGGKGQILSVYDLLKYCYKRQMVDEENPIFLPTKTGQGISFVVLDKRNESFSGMVRSTTVGKSLDIENKKIEFPGGYAWINENGDLLCDGKETEEEFTKEAEGKFIWKRRDFQTHCVMGSSDGRYLFYGMKKGNILSIYRYEFSSEVTVWVGDILNGEKIVTYYNGKVVVQTSNGLENSDIDTVAFEWETGKTKTLKKRCQLDQQYQNDMIGQDEDGVLTLYNMDDESVTMLGCVYGWRLQDGDLYYAKEIDRDWCEFQIAKYNLETGQEMILTDRLSVESKRIEFAEEYAYDPSEGEKTRTEICYAVDESGKFIYRTQKDGSVGIMRYLGEETEVTLPSSIYGKKVTMIGEKAFFGCDEVEKIILSDSIETVYNRTFYGCKNLREFQVSSYHSFYKTVDGILFASSPTALVCYPQGRTEKTYSIPEGTQKIRGLAFQNDAVETIILPESLDTIGYHAFEKARSLERIEVNERNDSYLSEKGILFTKDKTEFICYPPAKGEGSYVIPDTVENIRTGAFSNLRYLENIDISGAVSEIMSGTFQDSSLKNVILSAKVEKIEPLAFSKVENLTVANRQCSMSNIAVHNECIKSIYGYTNSTAEEYAQKYGCEFIPEYGRVRVEDFEYEISTNNTARISEYHGEEAVIEIPEEINGKTVTQISTMAFQGCSFVTQITIPETVAAIGSSAFRTCSSLEKIEVPDSVTEMGLSVFEDCSSLREIVIPHGITDIREKTFSGCTSLEKVVMPESLKTMGRMAFAGCSSLSEVTIPNGVAEIPDMAFWKCESLRTITIPDTVQTIGEMAFLGCTSLESVVVPQNVTSIEVNAFEDVKNLTILNPQCMIEDSAYTIGNGDGTTIYGYAGSTAQSYAEKYQKTFVALE